MKKIKLVLTYSTPVFTMVCVKTEFGGVECFSERTYGSLRLANQAADYSIREN